MDVQAHVLVSGMVQGVGYRYFVCRLAAGLGLRGWVRNIAHGEVEILVQGSKAAIESLVRDLWVGNPSASVRNVTVEWSPVSENFGGFHIAS
jgi:acylphosphatase